MTARRIYFVSSDYSNNDEPPTTLAYWDPQTGQITEVSPNCEWDVGAGFAGMLPDNKGLIVEGLRWLHYFNPVNYGDYWDDEGSENLDTDTFLYTVDPALQGCARLNRETVDQTANWGYGFLATDLWGYEASRDYDRSNTPFWDDVTQQYLVVGHCWDSDIYDPIPGYSNPNAGIGYGFVLHRYTAYGQLVRRSIPWEYYGNEGAVSGSEVSMAGPAVFDRKRRLIYFHDGWAVWCIDVDADHVKVAPSVFPWVQTQAGWDWGTVESMVDNPNFLVQGPYPDGKYSYIEEKDYWRSRRILSLAVDQGTGYLWALVHGYEPYGQEYNISAHGTPVSSSPGGWWESGDEYDLICIDPTKLFWIDQEDLPNPFPNDFVDSGGWPRSTRYIYYAGPHAAPPQQQADVAVIPLVKGRNLLSVTPNPAVPVAPDANQVPAPVMDELFAVNPDLRDPYWDRDTGVTLVTGQPTTIELETTLYTASCTTAELIAAGATLTGLGLRAVFKGPLKAGSIRVALRGPSGTTVPLATWTPADIVDPEGVNPYPRNFFPIDRLGAAVEQLKAGPCALVITADATQLLESCSLQVAYDDPSKPLGGVPAAGVLMIPSDEPGYGYVTLQVAWRDDGEVSGTAQWVWDPWTVFRVSLADGTLEPIFSDDRRNRSPEDTAYLLGLMTWQLLPGAFYVPIDGEPIDSRRAFL